jgi:hypothetical protein
MIVNYKSNGRLVVQLLGGSLLTLLLTYFSMAIADHVGTPELIRYIFSPGYVFGMRYASGSGFFDTLGSFARISLTVNIIYYGLVSFLLFRKFNWPKRPRNPRHHFWMEP